MKCKTNTFHREHRRTKSTIQDYTYFPYYKSIRKKHLMCPKQQLPLKRAGLFLD